MIDKILNRTSCRNYLDKKISKDIVDQLKQIVNSSPTAINSHQFSAIFITDKKTKEELTKFNFNQPHVNQAPLIVLFFADLNRVSSNKEIEHGFTRYVDASIDAIIACSLLMVGANEMGLGTCILGGFRKWPKEVNTLLNINGKCVPTIGLSIGYSSKLGTKIPRINKCYDGKYDIDKVVEEVNKYDETIKLFYKKLIGKEISWKDMINKNLIKLLPNNSEDIIKKIFNF